MKPPEEVKRELVWNEAREAIDLARKVRDAVAKRLEGIR